MTIARQLIYLIPLIFITALLFLVPKYSRTDNDPNKCFEEINPAYLKTDPNSLIHIKNSEDISRVRSSIIQFLWQSDELPKTTPTKINRGVESPPYFDTSKMNNLAQIDEIIIDMDLSFTSTIYHLQPIKSNNKLFI